MSSSNSHESDRPRLPLTATQLIASVLAAVTAAIGTSYLGVNGTVIGAAIVSVLSVVGNAVFSHSLHRTGQRVRAARPLARAGIAATVVFATALVVLTGVELVAGHPLSDLLRGKSAAGTTVFGSRAETYTGPTPTVTVTQTVVPKVVVATPTITQTARAVTVTPTVTAPAAPVTVPPTATATPAPTATPGASDTPTSTP